MARLRPTGLVLAFALCLPAASAAASPKPVDGPVTLAPQNDQLDEGQRHGAAQIEVDYHGTWYAARILEQRAGLTKIRYVGWGAEWDEWIEADRLRVVRPIGRTRVGQRVSVEWGGTWWDATIVAKRGARVEIHYTGWGDEWNEWVGRERLRAAPRASRTAAVAR